MKVLLTEYRLSSIVMLLVVQAHLFMKSLLTGLFSVVLGLGGMFYNDSDKIHEGGFFQNYSIVVWIVITLQGLGGLVIAAVIKYAPFDRLISPFGRLVGPLYRLIGPI